MWKAATNEDRSPMSTAAPTWSVGDRHSEVLVENLTRTQIVMYAGASGDFSPIHTDGVYATEVAGYPSVFAHGMLTMALTSTMLTDWLGAGSLRTYGGRFLNQVWPGDTLSATAEVVAYRPHTADSDGQSDSTGEVDLEISTTNQDGTEVFRATATARVVK